MDSNGLYSINDWVVHTYYGVGQIKRIETKPIDGEATKCFKVKTRDSTFWFPTTAEDNPRIRPVATKDIMHKVIKNLRRKSNKLEADKSYWKQSIGEVQSNSDLLSISILIRDLSAQQVVRKLNQTEENALEHFKERLLREWASIVQEEVEKLRPLLQAYIQESQVKINVE